MMITSSAGAIGYGFRSDRISWLDTRAAFALLCLAAITPFLFVGMPPLVDLYGHYGRYVVQTDLANRPVLQEFYSYQWQLIGNLGGDLLVQALHGLLGLEAAIKLVVIGTQLLATAGILLVSRECHGRITPFAVMALPLIYGLPFNYGFLNFSLSMALGLLAFVLWIRLDRAGRNNAARIWLGVAGAIIWVCHTFGWAFLGLLCGSSVLAGVIAARERPIAALRHILGTCWPLLLPLVPMLVWRTGAGGLDLQGWILSYKLQWLISAFRNKWVVPDVVSLIAVVITIYWAVRTREVALDRRLGAAAAICFASFMILPVQVFGSMFADMRLVPYILIVALLAISPRGLEPKTLRIISLMAVAFFAGRTLVTGAAYVAQERTVEETLPAIESIPEGSRVAFLSIVPCKTTWELPVLSHMGGVALARRNVFVNNQWKVPGVNPLIVHYPAAAPFEHDPSQFVHSGACDTAVYPDLSQALRQIPQDAFTHVWIVGPVPDPLILPDGLEPVPHAGKGALLAVSGGQ